MKLLAIYILLFVCYTHLFADWLSFKNGNPKSKPTVQVLSQRDNVIELEITLPGIEVFQINHNNEIFQNLRLPGYYTTSEIGKPQVPKISELIAVPLDATLSYRIIDSSVTVFENYHLYPVQDGSEDKEKSEFIIDNDFYQKDIFYPGFETVIKKPNIWRDISIAELNIFPIQYNPFKRQLKIYSKIVLEIEHTSFNNQIFVRPNKSISKRWDKIYSNSIINYDILKRNFTNLNFGKETTLLNDDEYELLIIATDNLYDEILAYSSLKHRIGIRTKSVKLGDVGSTDDAIRNYIMSEYQNFNIEYVLLVGEHSELPLYCDDSIDSIYGDYLYTDLVGSIYPEIAAGRISAASITELDHHINKIISYTVFPPQDNWVENSLIVADDENAGVPDYYQDCKEDIEAFNYILPLNFTTAFGSEGAHNVDISNAINSGTGIVNYRGHGSISMWKTWAAGSESWTNTDATSLNNENKTPVVLSIACNTGSVTGTSDCLIEAFINADYGAVAAFGATQPTDRFANNTLDKRFYSAVFHNGSFAIGDATISAISTMLTQHGSGDDAVGTKNAKKYLWLGDPSMEIWASQPLTFDDINITDNGSSITVSTGIDSSNICVSSSDNGPSFYEYITGDDLTFNTPVRPLYISVTCNEFYQYIPYLAVTGGTFTTDQHWIGNLYVLGDLVVDNGAVLNIQQGTQIFFDDYTGITLNDGEINANGTSGKNITFTSSNENPSVSDWDGIKISSSSSSSYFNYCEFKYSRFGIRCISSEPTIRNSIFSNNSSGISIYDSYSNPNWNNIQISGNTFSNNSSYGIYLKNSSPAMSSNISTDNQRGISHSTGANAIMGNNQFKNSQYYGVLCYNSSPDYYFDSYADNGGLNIISYNNGNGVHISGNSNPELGKTTLSYGGFNTIRDNAYEVYNITSNYIIVCNNWWGPEPHPQSSDFYGRVRWIPYLDYEEINSSPPPDLPIIFEYEKDSNLPEDLQLAKFEQMIHNYETSSNGFKTHFIKNPESENNIFAAVNYVKSLGLYLKPEAVVTEIEKTLKDVKSDDIYFELLVQQSDYLLRSHQPEKALDKLEKSEKYTNEENSQNRIYFQKACLFTHHFNDYERGMDLLEKIIINSDKDSPIYELATEELNSIKYYSKNLSKKLISNESILNGFELLGNYPNPFNPVTKIKFSIPNEDIVTIEIFNTLGQKINTLLNRKIQSGFHEVEFNARDLASGVYFYRIEAGEFNDVKKMVLIR